GGRFVAVRTDSLAPFRKALRHWGTSCRVSRAECLRAGGCSPGGCGPEHSPVTRERIMNDAPSSTPAKRRSLLKRMALLVLCLVGVYVLAAYLVIPALWKRYAERHPAL